MRDEARHVAFGVLSLRDYYKEQPESREARARGLRLRGGARSCATASCSRRSGRRRACRSKECMDIALHNQGAGDVPPDAVREDRPGDQEDGPAVATASASASPSSASSSSRTGPTRSRDAERRPVGAVRALRSPAPRCSAIVARMIAHRSLLALALVACSQEGRATRPRRRRRHRSPRAPSAGRRAPHRDRGEQGRLHARQDRGQARREARARVHAHVRWRVHLAAQDARRQARRRCR